MNDYWESYLLSHSTGTSSRRTLLALTSARTAGSMPATSACCNWLNLNLIPAKLSHMICNAIRHLCNKAYHSRMLCSLGSQSLTCERTLEGSHEVHSRIWRKRRVTVLTCCSVTDRCASCASFCTSGGGKSLLAEYALLLRRGKPPHTDEFKRNGSLTVLRSSDPAEQCMPYGAALPFATRAGCAHT